MARLLLLSFTAATRAPASASTLTEETHIMTRSTLDPDNQPLEAYQKIPAGHDARALGRSDSSDSGSELIGDGNPDDDTSDREGTGERASVEPGIDTRTDTDIGFDRIVDASEAGLGGGLDQAEEAQLGITDEEIAAELGDEDDE